MQHLNQSTDTSSCKTTINRPLIEFNIKITTGTTWCPSHLLFIQLPVCDYHQSVRLKWQFQFLHFNDKEVHEHESSSACNTLLQNKRVTSTVTLVRPYRIYYMTRHRKWSTSFGSTKHFDATGVNCVMPFLIVKCYYRHYSILIKRKKVK